MAVDPPIPDDDADEMAELLGELDGFDQADDDDFSDVLEEENEFADLIDEADEGASTEERGRRVLAEVKAATKRLRQAEGRYATAFQESYWFAVYFQTDEQRAAFLAAMGWPDERYIRGLSLPQARGLNLPVATQPANPAKKINPKLAARALEIHDGQGKQISEGENRPSG